MKYIEEFKEADRIIEHYLCKQKQSLKSRSGKTYLSLKLQDKTGFIDAKVWDLTNDIQNFEEGDYIKIDGIVQTYQNDLQLKINKIRKSEGGEFEPMNYIPCTDKDIGTLYEQIVGYIQTIADKHIKALMENIFVHNSDIASAFKSHSAAKSMHHSYMGGLIEHTLNVVQICDFMSGRYKYVDRDLLIAAAMMHDLAKIYELSAFPTNDYTDDGHLLGHLVIGAEMINAEADKIAGFPHELKSLLKHCILAHHGECEFGSPKTPRTIEAFILHCADNADAKIRMFEEAIDADHTQSQWAGYHRMLQRNIRKPSVSGYSGTHG